MDKQERHAKMSEAVSQIGRLVGVCADKGLNKGDILMILQTATSLTMEMNDVSIEEYIQYLFVIHKKRLEPDCDVSDPVRVRRELRYLLTPHGEGVEYLI